ncbi:unnamed protein product [Paramecium primaurelia]|uniref:ER membrane protein complex subunit 3 n=1 Tax=Paramecium primaurelia TaxID=5886 RepID=A0A8S1KB45_PARPR|nr:unnamed protein product [Paramecium primaurelia]
MSDILIDDRIRDWVFLPIIIVMFMIQMFRGLLTKYMDNRKTSQKVTSKAQLAEMIDKNITQQSQRLARLHGLLPDQSFKMKRAHLCDHESGILTKASQKPAKDPMQSMSMMNPAAMADMLKQNLSGIIFMALQYQWVSYFFSGFVIGKVPFPLTQKFRTMLQRGVDVQNLDVRYISSISIYFVLLFGGLQKIQQLMFGDDNDEFVDDTQMQMQMQMMGMPTMPSLGQQNDPGKLFIAERTRLEGVKHTFELNKSQDKAMKSLKRFLMQ